jgi:hypothetical protein
MATISSSITPAKSRDLMVAGVGAVELKGRSASCSSPYDDGRSDRFFARQRRTTASRRRGIARTPALGGRGGSVAIRVTSAKRFRSSKGGSPVSK